MNASTVNFAGEPVDSPPEPIEPIASLQPTPMTVALARAGKLSIHDHLDYDGRPLGIRAFEHLTHPFDGLRFHVH